MTMFITIIIAGITLTFIAMVFDAKEKQRCCEAVKVLRLLGFKDTQIMNEMERRGWKRGHAGKSKMLESIAKERMCTCCDAHASHARG